MLENSQMSRCHKNQRLINYWFCDFEERNMTRDEQVEFLQKFGLISERKELRQHLSNIGLTTLRPYFCQFLVDDDFGVHFKEGTTWNDVHSLYEFDRKLRSLIFQSIQMFDAAFKEQISYHLGNKYGPCWQYEKNLFKEPRYRKLRDKQIVSIDVYNDIRQIIDRYQKGNRHECTFRSCHHLFYFSHYSRIYSHLREKSDQKCISWYFGVPLHIFCSWVHTLVKVRNLCAHDKYLWNRVFDDEPDELTFSTNHFWISNPEQIERNKIYYILCILKFLMQTVNPQFDFSDRLQGLVQMYQPVLSLHEMGFQENWEQEKLWQ